MLTWHTCAFEGCGRVFARSNSMEGVYCSVECKAAAPVAKWAVDLTRLKADGMTKQEIADAMEVSMQALQMRMRRLPVLREKNPYIDLQCAIAGGGSLVDPKAADGVVRSGKVVISKEKARELGLRHYFTGQECSRGHRSARLVIGRICCVCNNVRRRTEALRTSELASVWQ